MDNVNPTSSLFNPADMALKASQGQINPNMTVGEFLQTQFGVTPDSPVTELIQKIKSQAGNATMQGKMQTLGQGGGMPPRPAGQAPVSSMGDLASRLQTQS